MSGGRLLHAEQAQRGNQCEERESTLEKSAHGSEDDTRVAIWLVATLLRRRFFFFKHRLETP
jgi:hypothetical protein